MRQRQEGELPEEAAIRSYYEAADASGKAFAELLVRYAVSSSIFHLLVVLDNCDAIEEGEMKGEFSLHYTRQGKTHRLGEPPELLHDALPPLSELVRPR
jgi:hypothetical protein